MMTEENQATNSVLMVRPVAFDYNVETAADNVFQVKKEMEPKEIQAQALKEFDDFVALLRKNGIHVNVVEDTLMPPTPDSIFPNNWFTTHADGRVALYPLKAKNRREERRDDVLEVLLDSGFNIKHIEDFREAELENQFLEGTGSLVLDREKQLCYVSVSERSNPNLVAEFCEVFGYQPIFFQSIVSNAPVFHTNVVLSIAGNFAMLSTETISRKDELIKVKNALKVSGKEIIEITEEQVKAFAGNGLELINALGKRFFVLSTGAFSALSETQKKTIEKHATLLHSNLDTTETFGGGSARCMMAEVFLPHQRK